MANSAVCALITGMRILVLYNSVTDQKAPDALDVLSQVEAVSGALSDLGYEPVPLACDLDLEALRRDLVSLCPDLVFNLVESLNGQGRLIHLAPILLEAMGIPYTGSSAYVIYRTSNKTAAKDHMSQWGVATPSWIGPASLLRIQRTRVNPAERLPNQSWIIKSVWEHASFGLDENAVVCPDTLGDILNTLKQRSPALGGDCFAEHYIPGREFNVALIEEAGKPRVLPVAEIRFENYEGEKPAIVCYRAKWEPGSFECLNTVRSFEFPDSDGPLLEGVTSIARHCWDLFHLKGYARVDFRVDDCGNPWVLEVNANPCLSPDAGFAAAMEQAGISYVQAIDAIVRATPARPATATPAGTAPPPERDSQGFRYEVTDDDPAEVRLLASATGFFSPEEIEIAVELVGERLARGPASGYAFVFREDENGRLLGYACFGPVPCTRSSYDLYWIAVHPDFQKNGLGRVLMAEAERLIARAGGTQVYADTSDRPQYAPTRRFYERCGYVRVAGLPEFYGPEDGKVVFEKKLTPAA
ncbi:GCN5-related N-acetyltransferase [Desulfosudis oleivorans Hxd3]|uniref:GCN5-related N-acetyltransferase n=2 Tax=Desulfosudis TaxID=2904716 RepID=A8ZSF8_DESOH|nr:GCN5-related N-acetyltransferase [Desulfosudis oleivorans Hxd3]